MSLQVRCLIIIMRIFLQDFRYGIRTIRRKPGFSAAIVLTLALGIGASTAMFSVLDTLILKPLPYPRADRLLWISTYCPSVKAEFLASPEYVDWAEHNDMLENMAAYPHNPGTANLTGLDQQVQVGVARVTPSFFPAVGVQPSTGRAFRPGEERPGSCCASGVLCNIRAAEGRHWNLRRDLLVV